MEPDEIWAYRETGKHPLVPVRFIRHRRNTNKNNAHAHIRFEDPDADGLEDWVPTGRLKCLWADAEAFIARERRWADIRTASTVDLDIDRAVGVTLDAFGRGTISSLGGSEGVSPFQISDVSALSKLCGILEADLTSELTAFEEEGSWIVPFQTAEGVARALAAKHPDAVLRTVVQEERELEEEQLEWRQLGSPSRGKRLEDSDEMLRRSFEIRRGWVGDETSALHAELASARARVDRLSGLVEYAAQVLKADGHTTIAARLRKALNQGGQFE